MPQREILGRHVSRQIIQPIARCLHAKSALSAAASKT